MNKYIIVVTLCDKEEIVHKIINTLFRVNVKLLLFEIRS